jgi:hypothetical protein
MAVEEIGGVQSGEDLESFGMKMKGYGVGYYL